MNRPRPTADPNDLPAQMVELQQKLTFQQKSFEELNSVVLEQQLELQQLSREIKSLRQTLQGLADRGMGDDLPQEKPPHY